jgi:hypothetical protein
MTTAPKAEYPPSTINHWRRPVPNRNRRSGVDDSAARPRPTNDLDSSVYQDARSYRDARAGDARSADESLAPRRMHPHERGIPDAFGFSSPRNAYPYADVASEHRRGRFFGHGPKGYRRSDERIREDINDRLTVHPDIDASDIEVSVSHGIATLSGTAEDRHEKRLAELITEDVWGVDDVDNRLKVRHGLWATITGERSKEREIPTHREREGSASRAAGRAASARNSARRDSEAR